MLIDEAPPQYSPVGSKARPTVPALAYEARSPVMQKALLLINYALTDKRSTKTQLYAILDAVFLVPNSPEVWRYLRDVKKYYNVDYGWDALDRHLSGQRKLRCTAFLLYSDGIRRYPLKFEGVSKLAVDLEKCLEDRSAVLLLNHLFAYSHRDLSDAVHEIESRKGLVFREELRKRLAFCGRWGHVREIVLQRYDMQMAPYAYWDEKLLLEKLTGIGNTLPTVGNDNRCRYCAAGCSHSHLGTPF